MKNSMYANLLLACLFCASITTVSHAADIVTLHLPGGDIQGEVLKVTTDEVVIKDTAGKEKTIKLISLTPKEIYSCRLARLDASDAEGYFQLGKYCLVNGLGMEAGKAFGVAVKLDSKTYINKLKHLELDPHAASGSGSDAPPSKNPADSVAASKDPPRKLSEREARRARILAAGKAGKFPDVPWNMRLKVDTAHYHIEANVPDETCKYVQVLIEELYRFYSRKLNKEPKEKLNIYVFAHRKEFEQEARAAGAAVGSSVGGFYVRGASAASCAIYMPWEMLGDDIEPSSVLMHEGFHQFYHRTYQTGNPTWLNEGMAVYFENCKFDGEVLTDAYISPRTEYLQMSIRAKQNDSLKILLNMRHEMFDAEKYGEAWSFIYWLAWGKEPAKRQEFQNRLIRYLQPEVLKEAKNHDAQSFERITGLKLDELESDWKNWVISLNPNDPYGGKGDPRASMPK